MSAYIIRRILYAIPILIGVNVIVFSLFFFMNTPDDMAALHLGAKRVTPDMIDRWKREHSLDLPYFYNDGFRQFAALSATRENTEGLWELPGEGNYQLRVEAPQNQKLRGNRKIQISLSDGFLLQADDNSAFMSSLTLSLPSEVETQEVSFRVKRKAKASHNSPRAKVVFEAEKPGLLHRVILDYQLPIGLMERFTRTIFFERSVKMLFFQFGRSDRGKNIGEEISKRILPSMSITLPSFIFGLILCIFFAMILAYTRGTRVDKVGVFLCVIGMSISGLFYIIAGQVFFGKILKLFPISGYEPGISAFRFVLMPVLIAVIAGLGRSIRFYRTVFLEEMNKDYVRTARAKGVQESHVLFVHILKNAMIPILTGVVVELPFLITGSLLLESFFSIPGMGAYLLEAIRQQDFAVVQSMVALGSFLYIGGLLLTDISYTFVDPRVRLE